jgi:Domain of unknown function (DUF4349)
MRLTDDQIGAELHALRETPGESFAATLDRRASAGFPAVKPVARRRELTWGRLLPVLGALATVAVVAVVISNIGGGGTDLASRGQGDFAVGTSPSGGAAGRAVEQRNQSQGLIDKNGALAAGPPPTQTQPIPPSSTRPRNGRPQVQELSASLGLSTDADKLQGAADGVVDVTNRYDGFVDSSNVHAGGSNGHAFFTLRIPAVHLRDALDDLSDLGRVVSRDEGSTNVTGAYIDAGKTYHDARAKVDSLLEELRNASSPTEAAAIRQQLVTARQQLVAAREALRGVKGRVAYAPVGVEIRANGNGSWSIGDAADDAVGVLEAIAGGALVTLAVLVPLSALLALGWLGARELNRRRREAALD